MDTQTVHCNASVIVILVTSVMHTDLGIFMFFSLLLLVIYKRGVFL